MSTLRKRVAKQMIGAGLALFLDRLVGEPPPPLHPVAIFGKMMGHFERYFWRDTPWAGGSYAFTGIGVALVAGRFVGSPLLGTLLSTYLTVAERSLLEHACSIREKLLSGDLEAARMELPSLAGRDVENLGESEIARAVVESVAENSSDAVVAPMFYGAVFGSSGSFIYRAVNTMDAMVGHKNPVYLNFGLVNARLDDALNFIPSRLAGLLAMAIPTSSLPSVRDILRDAAGHPSPNAGVIESTYAHKLGVTLGGENSYRGIREIRGHMGSGPRASSAEISGSVRLCTMVDSFFAGLLICGGIGLLLDERRRG